MSYQSVGYQERRLPVNTGRDDYYYGGGYSSRPERHYNNMTSQRGFGQHEGYQQQDQYDYHGRGDDMQQGYREQPSHNGQQPASRYPQQQNNMTHRYPETFQSTGQYSGPAGTALGGYDAPRDPPDEWRAEQRDQAGYGNNNGPYGYESFNSNPRSPTAPTQQNYNNNRQSGYPEAQHLGYGVETRGQTSHSGRYTGPTEHQRRPDWDQRQEYVRAAPSESRRQENSGEMWQDRDHHVERMDPQQEPYHHDRRADVRPPVHASDRQTYGGQRQEQPYNQYNGTSDQRPRQDAYRSDAHNENLRVSEPPPQPPQVFAKTSGSTAVFGIVAKVDSSPTRRVTSPEDGYGPQHHQREPPHMQPRQRSSQSIPNRPPSPPISPGSRGQSSGWTNPDPARQYGPPVNFNQNRPPTQQHQSYGRQYDDNTPTSYGQTRLGERPPPIHRMDKFRDEYNESSGYGSESTHNTDRSYRDQLSPNNPPHDGRQPDYHRLGQPPHSSHTQGNVYRENKGYDQPPPPPAPDNYSERYSDAHRPPAPDFDRQPKRTGPGNFPERYDGDRQPPAQRDERPYNWRDDQLPSNQGGQSGYVPRPAQFDQPRDYGKTNHPPPTNDQYRRDQYNRTGPPEPRSPNMGYGGPAGARQRSINSDSGVEEPHVKSVRAAKNMFEKQSDPRRPPPAPKPLTKPKPLIANTMNTRPVPPRPRNLSEGGWNRQSDEFPPPPQIVSSPRSPSYGGRVRFDERPQSYQENQPPSHSQSLYNLDDRSRYNGPSDVGGHQQQHEPQSKSMLNLDDRSSYDPHGNECVHPHDQRPVEGYRNSYSAAPDTRPMVIGVKYNQDGALTTHSSHDQRPQEGRRRDSWNGPGGPAQYRQQQNQGPVSPTRSQTRAGGWSNDPIRNEQSYGSNRDIRSDPSAASSYGPPVKRPSDSDNYVPDVVARSYEAFTQSQPPVEQRNEGYPEQARPPEDFLAVPQNDQRYRGVQNRSAGWENRPENRNSVERWPTPPPPVQDQPKQPQTAHNQYKPRDQTQNSYNDDWRRPGHQPPLNNPQRPRPKEFGGRPPPTQHRQVPTQPHQGAALPPPPQQPYRLDSDSSEGIDVDAPTPPPANKLVRAPHLQNNRSESPYDRNKPTPVTNRGPDLLRQGRPNQERPPGAASKSSLRIEQNHDKTPPDTKSPPPQKPQRNSVHVTSPQDANGQVTPENNKNEFDFDVGHTQLLTHATSRERQRLGKSGALANRKPPSRQVVEDDDNGYQIEVTDQDLTHKPSPIEVHREESMRVIRAKKSGLHQEKDTSSSSDIPSVVEKPAKQNSHRSKSAPREQEKESVSSTKPVTSDKKVDSKLLFKIPSQDVSKAVTAHPVPEITEPKGQANKRPPTYLGFGYSPEKPKTDLLTQFKTARDGAMRSAAEKQERALKSVSAMVKFSHGKKEPKSPPKPKLTAGERNAKVLEKLHVEVKPSSAEKDYHDRHHHHEDYDRGDSKRTSTRSTSTVKAEKYDGDDDTTNGSRNNSDRRGRGRDRHHDDGRAKSRGRSRSREREISPDRSKTRGRSRSRERALSPSRGKSRGRSRSLERDFSPEDRGKSRGRSRSRERALSPSTHHKSHGRDYDERRRYNDEPPYHRRSHSPDRHRNPDSRDSRHQRPPQHYNHSQQYDRHGTREPDWVEQFRRGRERGSHPSRRAWVNDPRRVEVVPGGSRRELDMDAFEREVRRATSYNSDFEQPEPRRQMIPTKLMSHGRPPPTQRKPNTDWMNALKERNKSAARQRFGKTSRY